MQVLADVGLVANRLIYEYNLSALAERPLVNTTACEEPVGGDDGGGNFTDNTPVPDPGEHPQAARLRLRVCLLNDQPLTRDCA